MLIFLIKINSAFSQEVDHICGLNTNTYRENLNNSSRPGNYSNLVEIWRVSLTF